MALKKPGVFTPKTRRAPRLIFFVTHDLARRSICIKQRSFSFADCPANEKIILFAYPFDRLIVLSKVEGFAP